MQDAETTRRNRARSLDAARLIYRDHAAHRAVDDPVRLARAARIVRAALARKKITLAELTPIPEPENRKKAS